MGDSAAFPEAIHSRLASAGTYTHVRIPIPKKNIYIHIIKAKIITSFLKNEKKDNRQEPKYLLHFRLW